MRGGEGGEGGDWLAKPTSPVDREQMGPDSLLTHQCQGYLGLLPCLFGTGVYSNDSRVRERRRFLRAAGKNSQSGRCPRRIN